MIISNSQNLASTSTISKVLVLALLFIPSRELIAKKKYPLWFLKPDQKAEQLVGYSTAGVLAAEQDAIWRYSFYKQGYLSGSAIYFNDEDQWQKKYTTEAQVPLLGPEDLLQIDMIATSVYGGGEEIALFVPRRGNNITIDPASWQFPDAATPEWVEKAPYFAAGDILYGVGQYVLKANENDAWRTAEERALIEIASVLGVEIDNRETWKKDRIEKQQVIEAGEAIKITSYTFDHEFKNARILERWVKYPEEGMDALTYIYVLMSIPRNQINHNLVGE